MITPSAGLLLATLAAAPVAIATPDEPPVLDAPAGVRLDVNLSAGVWLARVDGTVSKGAGGSSIDVDTDLSLAELEATMNIELDLRAERWSVHLHGFSFAADGREMLSRDLTFGGLSLNSGEMVRSSFDLTSLSVEVGYAFRPEIGEHVALRFSPTIGLRYFDLIHDITAGAGRESIDTEHLAALGGVRLDIDIWQSLTFQFDASIGGMITGGGHFVAVGTSVTWRPHPNVGLSFGYRQIDQTLRDGRDEYDGRLAGVLFSGSIRF